MIIIYNSFQGTYGMRRGFLGTPFNSGLPSKLGPPSYSWSQAPPYESLDINNMTLPEKALRNMVGTAPTFYRGLAIK